MKTEEKMAQPSLLIPARMKTPRAAALAGIIFSVLFATTIVLLRISAPAASQETLVWPTASAGVLVLALDLVPFAGIAFLWFIGVIRDRLGANEDRFFATVFFGSAILFLAMFFAAAAVAGATVIALDKASNQMIASGGYVFGRAIIDQIMNVYALKMAGVFMVSCATLTTRTRVLPRVITLPGYVLAVLLLVSSHFLHRLALAFPLWVFVMSAYILIENLRFPNHGGSSNPTGDNY